MKRWIEIFLSAFRRFNDDDGAAIASHLALSVLLSLFPFLLVVSALVSLWADRELTDRIFGFILQNWPLETSTTLRDQFQVLLSQGKTELFSYTGIIAILLASNGVEAARVGLNRAYGRRETRTFLWRRTQSILFVVLGAIVLIFAALILVAAPLVWTWLSGQVEGFGDFALLAGILQYVVPFVLLATALYVFHAILPAGWRDLKSIAFGILFTLVGIFLGSRLFSLYLQYVASYSALYAGLAGIMSALIYLYVISLLFLFGAELNAALLRSRETEG